MSERAKVQTKDSAAPSQVAPSPQFQERPFTDERYQPVGSASKISTDGQAQQEKIARASFNLTNIPIFAPTRSVASTANSLKVQQKEAQEEKKQENSADLQRKSDAEAVQPESGEEEKTEENLQMKAETPTLSSPEGEEEKTEENLQMKAETPTLSSPEGEEEKTDENLQMQAENQPLSAPEGEEEKTEENLQMKAETPTLSSPEGEEEKTEENLQMKAENPTLSSPEGEEEKTEENLQMKAENQTLSTPEGEEKKPEENQPMQSVQTKLTVGKPGDKYEQEADSMATKVMAMPDSAIQQSIQRTEEEEKEQVQRSPLANSITRMVQRQTAEDSEELQMKPGLQLAAKGGSKQASGNIESLLSSSKGGGSPLPDDVRSFMEPRLGADFSKVRVHTDSTAAQMNKELGAQAFAHGSDIYYGAGKSPGKDELTAHELTHTIQQGGAVPTKSVTQQEKKENKLQAKADSIQLTAVEPKIQRKENPQAQPAAAKVAPQTPAASPAAESAPGGTQAKTIEKPAAGGDAGGPAAPAGGGGGSAAGASSGGAAGGAVGGGGGNSPKSAQSDPGFQAVVNSTKTVATQEKSHPPAGTKSAEAQAAAVSPANEVESKAQDKQVQEMNLQQPGQFNAGTFKAALMEKISAATPQTLEEADNFKNQNKLDSVKGDLSSQVGEEKKQAANPIEEKTKEQPDTSGITPKSVTPLPPKQAGKAPSDIGADKAAPKPKSESEVSLQEGSKSIDKQMADADITEPQLAKSNEPQFQSALESKKTAQTHANTAPNAYRQQEQGILTQAQAQAQTTAQTNLQAMHGGREQVLTGVAGLQTDTKGQDEQKRSEVANHIQGIYNNTKQKVETLLNQLDGEVNQQFDQGTSAAKTEFENYVDQRMKRYKDERYSGFLGPGKWLWDKVFGMPSEVNAFYQEGKNKFLASMDKTIDNIANHVAKTLNAAKSEIAKGKQEISKYVSGLDPSLKQVGQEAAQEIGGKFDELEQSVDSKQDELIDNLAQKYNENLQQIDARIDQMKEENKGLVQKAIDFVVGVVKTIVELGKMLAQVLARAISVLPQIIANPVGFFSNLVNGVKQGFQNFMQNIGQHLAKGLIGWLSGKVASAGVQMPESLDAKGIFTLVTQIMGLTYENVRERAAKRLGEEKVSQLESTFEMFIVLKNQGIAGLWQFVQDTIGDLNQKVMEPVRNYIIESVIKAGITWIFSLLTPASAFIKACQAIYELVMFFVERASQVVDLVNAVLDSIVAIANGAIGEAAKKIEDSLAKALPLVIDLLARVLGLGGVSQKVQGMITKVRGPIDKAIDKVIDKGAKVASKAGDKFESGKGKGKKNKDRSKDTKDRAEDKYKTGDHKDRSKDPKNRTENKDKTKDNKDKKGKDGKPDRRTEQQKKADLNKALAQADQLLKDDKISSKQVKERLPDIKSKYKMTSLKLIVDSKDDAKEIVHVEGVINPTGSTAKRRKVDYSEALVKAKSEFGGRLFSRSELDTLLEVSSTTSLNAIKKWKEEGQLHTLASAPSDPLTQYSFDKNKAGQRETHPDNRSKYGYSNPKKDSAVGLKILSKGLRSDSPSPIQKDDPVYHKNNARYDSTRPGSTYKNFGFMPAILGHKDPGASGHWNKIGHKQSKADNLAWNKDPNNYQGPEHTKESSASGSSAERYIVPSKANESHSSWW